MINKLLLLLISMFSAAILSSTLIPKGLVWYLLFVELCGFIGLPITIFLAAISGLPVLFILTIYCILVSAFELIVSAQYIIANYKQ